MGVRPQKHKDKDMLGIVTLIFIVILSVKLSVTMNQHVSVMVSNAIPKSKVRAVQVAPLLYIPSLVGLVFPVSWLAWLAPIPFGLLLLVPGIVLGSKYSKLLECAGTDVAGRASRAVSNIMWLGLGVVIYIAGNIFLAIIFHQASPAL